MQVVSSSGQLGGGAKINIRGNTSLTGNNQPLFVIDGIPISNNDYSDTYNLGNMASDVSPDDIASMSILKGASATAIYGSRGANGVVLITTKKGGKAGQKSFGVTVNSSVTFDKVAIMPEMQQRYGGGYSTSFDTTTINGKTYNIPEYSADASWGPALDGTPYLPWNSLASWDTENYLQEKAWEYPENDYKSFFQTGIGYNNSVAISGSGESHSYRLSYSNLNQTGTVDKSTLKRNTISFNATAKISDYIDSWVNGSYTNTNAQGRQQGGYEDQNVTKTIFQWSQTQLDYNALQSYMNPDGSQRTWNRTSLTNGNTKYNDNPYWIINKNYQSDNRDRFFGNTGVNINVIDGMKITARIGVDFWNFTAEERVATGSVGTPTYILADRNSIETNMDLFATYNKRFFDEKFGISALAGTNSNDQRYGYTGGKTNGGLVVPGIYNLSNSLNKSDLYDTKTQARTNAIYGNLTLDYKQIVYIDITARNDWSSTLPSSHRSFFYPSVNLSVMLNELGPLKDLEWLDFAKVRGGYAKVGNGTTAYNLNNYYTIEYPFGSDPMFGMSSILRNPDLRPESTKSWEVGFEALMLNRRLGIDISYYQKSTTDQIIPATVSNATGYTKQYINAGELYNSGIEITINGTPVQSKSGFRWDTQLNISTLYNEVKSIAPDINEIILSSSGFSTNSSAVVGESYPMITGVNYVYGENGEKLVGENGLYLKSQGSENLGKVTPDFTLGFSNTFSYKNLELSVLFDMQMGGNMYYMSHEFGMYSGMLPETAMDTNVPGLDGDIRQAGGYIVDGVYGKNVFNKETGTYQSQYTDANGDATTSGVRNTTGVHGSKYSKSFFGTHAGSVFSTDYIKLREVSISYTIPQKLTGPIKNIKVSAFGRNLATFMTDQDYYDPEYTTNSGINGQGLETGYIPTTATFGFSLGFGF